MASIEIQFSSASDAYPLVVLDGRLVTATEIIFSKQDGLTIRDSAGNPVAEASSRHDIEAQIRRYFEKLDQDDD